MGLSPNAQTLSPQDGPWNVLGRVQGAYAGEQAGGCVVTRGAMHVLPETVGRVGPALDMALETFCHVRTSMVGRWNVPVR